jgi:hypothetical protein
MSLLHLEVNLAIRPTCNALLRCRMSKCRLEVVLWICIDRSPSDRKKMFPLHLDACLDKIHVVRLHAMTKINLVLGRMEALTAMAHKKDMTLPGTTSRLKTLGATSTCKKMVTTKTTPRPRGLMNRPLNLCKNDNLLVHLVQRTPS